MKKYLSNDFFDLTKQFYRKMKITCLILLVFASSLFSTNVKSQVAKVSISIRNANVSLIIDAIESQTDYLFVYNKNEIDLSRKVDIDVKDKTVAEVLRDVFADTNVVYAMEGSNIMLIKAANIQQQQKSVSGKVTDISGAPLPGVAIAVAGTSNGTVTDLNGNFTLMMVPEDAVLQFSFVGMKKQEVKVNGATKLSIVLEEESIGIEEVVAIGYGSIKKRDLVGSVSSINDNALSATKGISDFVGMMQGRAAGLSIQSQSGVPGAESTIRIRGINTLQAGQSPLWIVDGIPIISYDISSNNGSTGQSPMSLINPADIENIQVLKDAAATAIYGSRGANGVILVTTKSGSKGKGVTSIEYSTGISDLTRKPSDIGFCNTTEWFSLQDIAAKNAGVSEFDPLFYYQLSPYAFTQLTREQALGINTNWYDQIMRNGSYTNVNISSSRGFEKGSFYISGNYRNDESVLKYNNFKRFSLRTNIDFSPIDNLELGAKLSLSNTQNDRMKSTRGDGAGNASGTGGGFATIVDSALPWLPVWDPNDQTKYYNPLAVNPVAQADPENIKDFLEQYRVLGGFYAQYHFPFLKGLTIRSEGSFDILQSNQTNWISAVIREKGTRAFSEAVTARTLNYNAYATYDRSFAEHNFNFVIGTEAQRDINDYLNAEGQGLNGTYHELGKPSSLVSMNGGIGGERYLLSYFSRLNYKFKDCYLFSLSYRGDGSSKFPEEKRWGTFAAASAGWVLSEEEFMAFMGTKNYLKIRASFGQTGNENIPSYLFVQNYTTNSRYGSQDILGENGTFPSNLPSGLTWEKTSSYDIGLDFGLWSNRVTGSFTYFSKWVDNLLLKTPLPLSSGIDGGSGYVWDANSAWGNIGRLNNSGIEFEFNSVNINKGDFKWTTQFNIGTTKNIIKRLGADGKAVLNGNTNISAVGGVANEWYLAKWADVDPATGVERIYLRDAEYYSQTGETRVQKTSDGMQDSLIYADKTAIKTNVFRLKGKSQTPTYYGGVNNTLEYKGFDFNFFVTFSGGNYIYDYDEQITSYVNVSRNIRKDVLNNHWEKPGDIARSPKPLYNAPYQVDGKNYDQIRDFVYFDKFLYKGDYIRLKNVQLGYNFPQSITEKLWLQNLRIYASATNLLTITDFKGWDPEGATFIYEATVPQLKTFSFGLNVKF